MAVVLRERERRVALTGRVRRAALIARGYEPLPTQRERIRITEVALDTGEIHPSEVLAESVPIGESVWLQPINDVTESLGVQESVRVMVGTTDAVRDDALLILEALAENVGAGALMGEHVSVQEAQDSVFAMLEGRTEAKTIVEHVTEGLGGDLTEPLTITETATVVAAMRDVLTSTLLVTEGKTDAFDALEARLQAQVVHEVATSMEGITEATKAEVVAIQEAVVEGVGFWVADNITLGEVMTSVVDRLEPRAESVAVAEAQLSWITSHNFNEPLTEAVPIAEARTAMAMLREALAEAVPVAEAATDVFVAGTLESILPAPQAGMYLAWNSSGVLVNKTAAEILATLFGTAPPAGGFWINTSP